jgi:hypothetical protein
MVALELTPKQGLVIYWFDRTWQRSEEGLLILRYCWWCAQFAVLVVLPMIWRHYGAGTAFRAVVFIIDWRYVYPERHSWTGTEKEPVSAVTLIMRLREESEARQSRPTLLRIHEELYGNHFVTPLEDRASSPWDEVECDRIDNVVQLSRLRPDNLPERIAA